MNTGKKYELRDWPEIKAKQGLECERVEIDDMLNITFHVRPKAQPDAEEEPAEPEAPERRTDRELSVQLAGLHLTARQAQGQARSLETADGLRVDVIVTLSETRLLVSHRDRYPTLAEWRRILLNWHYDVDLGTQPEPYEYRGWQGLRGRWATPKESSQERHETVKIGI